LVMGALGVLHADRCCPCGLLCVIGMARVWHAKAQQKVRRFRRGRPTGRLSFQLGKGPVILEEGSSFRTVRGAFGRAHAPR
jgi:hypothetical protein